METKTIRLSFGSLILVLVLLAAMSVLGGYAGTRMFPPHTSLLSGNGSSVVPIAQQVIISPNKSAQEIVSAASRSIFLLVSSSPKGIIPIGSATALTNDGIFMSLHTASEDPVFAIGENGLSIPLTLIGTDALTGISFFKASGQIVAPLEMSQNAPTSGETLFALYRQKETAYVATRHAELSSITLPSSAHSIGLQKIGQLMISPDTPVGTALLDDSGKLAGALIDPVQGTAMFISDIRGALERLSQNALDRNPFAALGFTAVWQGEADDTPAIRIVSKIDTVLKDSIAGRAGLRPGDILSAVGSNAVSWDTPLVSLLGNNPQALTIVRQGEQRTLPLVP